MFRILGIKILEGCFESVHKILKVGVPYLLFDYYEEDKDNPYIKKLVKVLQSEKVRKFIEDNYDGAVIPAAVK